VDALTGRRSTVAIRVFLVDDHEVVRAGLRALFEAESDIEVVGEAASAAEAMRRIPPTAPDVALLDVRLPDGSGVEVCREVRAANPELACLMLTSYADDEALAASVLAGAQGYLLKQVGASNLVEDVRRVAGGESLIDPATAEAAVAQLRSRTEEDPLLAVLTPQERRILDQLAEGRTNRQIAESMYLAEKTVKNYVSNLLAKLGMERRTQAATYAARLAERRDHAHDVDRSGT
jgi:two-component system, NarL family, response regulator DevR